MRRTTTVSVIAVIIVISVSGLIISGCAESTPDETVIEEVYEPASQAATEANLRTIDSAIQAYFATEGEYPSNINDLVPGYLKKVPVDEDGGTYCIVVEGGIPKAAVK